MHKENVTRNEKPPVGGIFLCPEIELPPLVEELIQRLPELLVVSQRAKLDLDVEFEKLSIQYGNKFLSHGELKLTPNAVYTRLMRATINNGWKQNVENHHAVERIGKIEALKSDASVYEDARATICGFGERVVEVLKPNLPEGLNMIGSRQYEIILENGGTKWFCGFDEVTSKRVYFNRWDQIGDSLARPAFLQDYVWLMGDIRMERAKLVLDQ